MGAPCRISMGQCEFGFTQLSESDELCDGIRKKRVKNKLRSIDDLKDFISAKKQKMYVDIREDSLERIVLS